MVRSEHLKAAITGLLLACTQPVGAQPGPARLAREQGCRGRSSQEYALPSASTEPAANLDGKVSDLNPTAFEALAAVKRAKPGPIDEKDAQELKRSLLADGKVDDQERELLDELLASRMQSITVSELGQSQKSLVVFPVSGKAREVLMEVLHPPLDFAQEWEKGAAGYANIVESVKQNPPGEKAALAFLEQKLGESWHESSTANAYRPLRDRMNQCQDWAMKCSGNVPLARGLLYKAMLELDEKESDRIPDFLYQWIRPATS